MVSRFAVALAFLGLLNAGLALADQKTAIVEAFSVQKVEALLGSKYAERFQGFMASLGVVGAEQADRLRNPAVVREKLVAALNDRLANDPRAAAQIERTAHKILAYADKALASQRIELRSSGDGAIAAGDSFVGAVQTNENTAQAFVTRIDELAAQNRAEAALVREAKSVLAAHPDEANVIGRGFFTLCGEFTPEALNTYLKGLIAAIEEPRNTAVARREAVAGILEKRTGASREVARRNAKKLGQEPCFVYGY